MGRCNLLISHANPHAPFSLPTAAQGAGPSATQSHAFIGAPLMADPREIGAPL